MKINKAYDTVFKALVNRKFGLKKFELDQDKVFISPDGFFGFVFCKKGIPFNLDEIQSADSKLKLQSVVKPENQLRKTKSFVMLQRIGLISVFKDVDRKVYINSKYLNYFEEHAEFYQDEKFPLSLVVIVENGQIVGAVCPVRYKEEDEE